MTRTKSCESISTKQETIAKLARNEPKWILTTLAHHIDEEWLREAYSRIRKDAAAGVDGVTAEEYEETLDENLKSLLDRFKSMLYRAPAVRRVYLPKEGDPKGRPIGIPTLEDKILQRAVMMVLEPIYEHDFMDCSYGYRPGRSAHQALEILWQGLKELGGGWVIDLDIQKFFDSVERKHVHGFLDQRVRDGVIRRVIGKWLRAGVMEEGTVQYPERGTPQGGVVSPLLANIYLHEVLDLWFEHDVKPRLLGRAFMIRYADDATLVFEREDDAKRVMEVLPKRFGKYGLKLNPTKTRMVDFRRPSANHQFGKGQTFDLLGFTHYWGHSRKGYWIVKRKTAKARLSRALKRISLWCRKNRHEKVSVQHQELNRKLRGHDNYYGVTGNARSLKRFRRQVERIWRKWLDRRSRERHMTWERFERLLARYPLAPPKVARSVYRAQRNHTLRSRMR